MSPLAPDWLAALAGWTGAITAVLAAWIGLRTFHHQQVTNDVELALSVFAEINRYWDRIDEGLGSRRFNFGQILAYFEIAASLFNDGVLTNQASKILKDHIVEVFAGFQSSDEGRALLEHCRSSETTFEELERLAKHHFPKALLALTFADQRRSDKS